MPLGLVSPLQTLGSDFPSLTSHNNQSLGKTLWGFRVLPRVHQLCLDQPCILHPGYLTRTPYPSCPAPSYFCPLPEQHRPTLSTRQAPCYPRAFAQLCLHLERSFSRQPGPPFHMDPIPIRPMDNPQCYLPFLSTPWSLLCPEPCCAVERNVS